MEEPSRFRKTLPTAQNKMMDYLSHRQHSELELREKLKLHFALPEIDSAVEFGKEQGWIPNTPEALAALSQFAADSLRRKGKGQIYINTYLEKLGLPAIPISEVEEVEKALETVKNKFSDLKTMDLKEKTKVARFLTSRGFNPEVIRKVIYE